MAGSLRLSRLLRVGTASLMLGVALIGCVDEGSPELEARAAEYARDYFAALTQEPDHGWDLLSSSTRAAWGDIESYRTTAEAADWATFEVQVVRGLVCHDGTTCSVCLEVEPDTIPDFLLASPRLEDGIALADGLGCGNATIGVYLAREPGDGSGLMVMPKQ